MFNELTQGDKTIANYTRGFQFLESHAYMLIDESKIDRYVDGLHPKQIIFDNSHPVIFHHALKLTLKQERNLGLVRLIGIRLLGLTRTNFTTYSIGTILASRPNPQMGKRKGKGKYNGSSPGDNPYLKGQKNQCDTRK